MITTNKLSKFLALMLSEQVYLSTLSLETNSHSKQLEYIIRIKQRLLKIIDKEDKYLVSWLTGKSPYHILPREYLYIGTRYDNWINFSGSKRYQEVNDGINHEKLTHDMVKAASSKNIIVTFLGMGCGTKEYNALKWLQSAVTDIRKKTGDGAILKAISHELSSSKASALAIDINKVFPNFKTYALFGKFHEIDLHQTHSCSSSQIVYMGGFTFNNEPDPEEFIARMANQLNVGDIWFFDFGMPMDNDHRRYQKWYNNSKEINWHIDGMRRYLLDVFDLDGKQSIERGIEINENIIEKIDNNGGYRILLVATDLESGWKMELNRWVRYNPEYIEKLLNKHGFKVIDIQKNNINGTKFCGVIAQRKN